MKIKLEDLNRVKYSLSKLLTVTTVPARVAWRCTKFSKLVSKELEELETTRIALCEQYGKLDEKEGRYVFPGDGEAKFKEDFEKVLQEEVEFPDVKIAVGDLEKAGLSMMDFAHLDFLIDETDPTDKKG